MSRTAQIDHAAQLLRSGGLVAFPTETVYGLGANALDVQAVARVFAVKGRPHFDPLIVHLADPDQAADLVTSFPEQARALAEHFWPGPLTLVLPKKSHVPDLVTAGLPTVGVRVPDQPMARELIRKAGVPVAAPSANRFGRLSPTTAAHVAEQFPDEIDLILDGGPCRVGVESTVLSLAGEKPLLLRPGGVTVEQIEALIGPVSRLSEEEQQPLSPGRLPLHYAPTTPFVLHEPRVLPGEKGRIGLLCLRRPADTKGFLSVEVLSECGDLREAAANLFASLRRLDAAGLDLIVAEPVPEFDLGLAIMDRLRRASAWKS